jgi:hypothetical protein
VVTIPFTSIDFVVAILSPLRRRLYCPYTSYVWRRPYDIPVRYQGANIAMYGGDVSFINHMWRPVHNHSSRDACGRVYVHLLDRQETPWTLIHSRVQTSI